MDDVTITHNEGASRYELNVGDELVTVADYRRQGDVLIFHHTETNMTFRGKGLAEQLVHFALDDVATKGLKVIPECWFVADVIEANAQYAVLVAA